MEKNRFVKYLIPVVCWSLCTLDLCWIFQCYQTTLLGFRLQEQFSEIEFIGKIAIVEKSWYLAAIE